MAPCCCRLASAERRAALGAIDRWRRATLAGIGATVVRRRLDRAGYRRRLARRDPCPGGGDGLSGLPRTGGGAQSSARPLGEDQLQPLAMVGREISPGSAMSAAASVRRLDVTRFDRSSGLAKVALARLGGRAICWGIVINLDRQFQAQNWLRRQRLNQTAATYFTSPQAQPPPRAWPEPSGR